jgi:hypothetical protein
VDQVPPGDPVRVAAEPTSPDTNGHEWVFDHWELVNAKGPCRPDPRNPGCDFTPDGLWGVQAYYRSGNEAPSADAGTDQSPAAGAAVTLDGTGSSDPDGDWLTNAWTQTSGLSVTLTDEATSTPEFTAAPTGPYPHLRARGLRRRGGV